MVATWKTESENEETQENVRPRATVATNLGEGMAKVGQQVAKLMVSLTQTRQGSSPSNAPGSPWNGAMDGGRVGGHPQVPKLPLW